MRIDCHNHVMPRSALELLRESTYGMKVEHEALVSKRHAPIPLVHAFTDPEAKLEELGSKGIDGAIISINPPLFAYDAPARLGEELCRAANQGMAEFCAADPQRFHWMAHVPLQEPELALTVLRDAVSAGCVGVAVCSLVGNQRTDSEQFEPFWDGIDELAIPVFVHPGESNPAYPGLHDYFLQNVIGNLLETTIAVERFICSGLFDRHPDLRLLLPHGGGYFPYQSGRLRHAQTVRPELASHGRAPASYASQIFVDTVTHDTSALKYLTERMGPMNVVLGTDLPTPMADGSIVRTLEETVGPEQFKAITEDNVTRLFRLG